MTKNAVLASPEHGVKASLRSPLMLPRVAIVDPDLLAGVPPPVLAASGLDALSQLIEPFLSIRANPVTDGLAREGIRRSAARAAARVRRRARRRARSTPDDREALALASLLRRPVPGQRRAWAPCTASRRRSGGMFEAPHGAVCAALLPAVLRVNARALAARAPDSPALARCRELAPMLTGRPGASLDDGIAWIDGAVPLARDPRARPLRHDRRHVSRSWSRRRAPPAA